jgi:methylenetetrahydrofolate reductase (NADPH)
MAGQTLFSRVRPPTIVELLEARQRPLFSFELFPPKDAEQGRQLWRTVRELESLGPDFVSVTYGASGSTRERTIEATEAISRHTTLRTMAHLTCASQSRDQLRRVIGSYAAAGVRHVLAIRGDMPGGPTVPWVRHDEGLANATELVAMIRELGDFCIGVAAFPDLHPERHDAELDARVLVEKARAGAGFAITQLFFTADRYFDLVDRVRSLGCDLPIIPGIMPVTRLSQIQRFADLSGAELPSRVTDRLNAVGTDDAQVRQVGIDLATELSEGLMAGGAPGLHFITMNRSLATREIFARIQRSMSRV